MDQQKQALQLPTVRIELIGGELRITPSRNGGTPVVIDPKKLDRWAIKVYREGIFR